MERTLRSRVFILCLLILLLAVAAFWPVHAFAQTTPCTSLPTAAAKQAGLGNPVTLSWTAPTTNTDGSSIPAGTALAYNIDTVTLAAGACAYTPLASAQGISGLSTPAMTTLPTGTTCFAVDTQNGAIVGPFSNPLCVNVVAPPGAPPGFTITVTISVSPSGQVTAVTSK